MRKSALLLAAAAALIGAPHSVEAATPGFKLPFVCGESYVGSTYSGHGYAIDFNQSNNADRGDPVLASAAGTVTQTAYVSSNGQITISHGSGWQTKYAHMSGVAVRLNQEVRQGQLLGYVDDVGKAYGDHLHFEQNLNGTRVRSRFDGVLYTFGTWIRSTNACTTAPKFSETTPPTVSAPTSRFAVGRTVALTGPSVPVTHTWTVGDAGSGVAYSVLERRTNSDSYGSLVSTTDASTPTYTSYVTPSATTTRTHRVRATDDAGNVSSYATGPTFKVRRRQDDASAPDVRYAGPGWRSVLDDGRYSGGSVRAASAAGNSAILAFSGHDFAIVATTGPAMGRFEVYIDGVAESVVDLYRSSSASRRIVWARHFARSEPRTVELRVLGTKSTASAGTRVELDAFLILQP